MQVLCMCVGDRGKRNKQISLRLNFKGFFTLSMNFFAAVLLP